MHFIYQINSNHESRFNLFGLISQQCTTYMSCGRARTHDHRISSQRLTLSRHTGRQNMRKHMRAINITKSHVGIWTRINTRNANEKSVIDYAIMTDNLNDRIIESETDENNTLNIKGKHPTDHRAITMTLQMKRAHKPEIIHIWKKGNPEE